MILLYKFNIILFSGLQIVAFADFPDTYFKASSPFFFTLTDKISKTVLFTGRVQKF